MRKLKTLFALLVLSFFTIGQLWATIANPYSFTFANGDLTTSSTSFTKGGVTWSLSATEDQYNNTSGKTGYLFGSAKNPKTLVVSTSGISGTITSISITGRSNNKDKTATVSVTVGTTDFSSATATWDNGDNQTLTFTGSASGTIAVTITPDACGHVLSGISVSYSTAPTVAVKPTSLAFGTVDQHATVAAKTFKLKGSNLTAGIKLTAPTGYTVYPDTLTETQANVNDSVLVSVTPNTENYGTFNGNLTIASSKATPEFTTVNVPLTMSVTQTYAINTSMTGVGTIAWVVDEVNSPAYVQAGKTVTASATPDGNHTFYSLSLSENVTSKTIVDDVAEFTMPAGDVTISAVFNEKEDPTISVSETELDWGRVAKDAVVSGKTFTITGKNLTGNLVLTWDALGDQAFNYSVTSGSLTPDGNKDVSATVTVTPKSTASVAKLSDILQITGGSLAAEDEKEVEMDINVLQTYTVTWNINGVEKHSQTDTAGVALTGVPDATLASNGAIYGKEFKGWAEAAIAGEVAVGSAGIVATPEVMPATNKNYYAVYALKSGDDEPVLRQTLQYDDWSYTGTTSDMTSYRLFAENAYIESESFDLSTLTQVNVYAGTYGTLDNNKKKVTITDGSNTWKSCTLSTNSATTKNEVTNGSALTGTGSLRIVAGGGNGSTNGIRISKVEIYNQIPISYSKYATNGSAVTVDPASLALDVAAVDDGVISASYINVDLAKVKVATYNDTTCLDTLNGGWLQAALDGEKNIVYDAAAATYVVKKAFIKLTAPSSAVGVTTDATVIIPVAQAKKDPIFSSLEELAASDLPDLSTGVSVTFNNKIDSFYLYKGDTAGVYLNVTKAGKGIRIYKASEETINTWAVNGTLSGTMTSTTWKFYDGAWQVTAANAFAWSSLTYTAPSATAVDNTPIDTKAVKVLVDGQIFILRDGKTYTLQGQLVK